MPVRGDNETNVAPRGELTPERQRLDQVVRAAYGSVPKLRTVPMRPRRRCATCGARTFRPERCRPCEEGTR